MRYKTRLLAVVFCFGLSNAGATQKPKVDTTKSSTPTTITREELDRIPSSRNPLDVLRNLPPAPGYSTNTKSPPGLQIITLTTPYKEVIEVYLPGNLVAGHSFTGTIKVSRPPGSNAEQKHDYWISTWNQQFKLEPGSFDINLGEKDSIFAFSVLRDKEKRAGSWELPLRPYSFLGPAPEMPTSGTAGNQLVVHCAANGSLSPNDYFKIGGKPMQILTSTVGTVVLVNTYDVPGITDIETNVGGTVQRSKFRNITLSLSADKLNLKKGESTELRIVVGGLEHLQAPARMTIDASGAIYMGGGNSQKLTIEPAAVNADGTYRAGNTLTGLAAGTFGVKVVVSVEKENF